MTPAQIVVAGGEVVRGIALVTDVPLSFWGGVDPATGTVIDQHHPLRGKLLTDRILILPSGRGSCSASGVLLEEIYKAVHQRRLSPTWLIPSSASVRFSRTSSTACGYQCSCSPRRIAATLHPAIPWPFSRTDN